MKKATTNSLIMSLFEILIGILLLIDATAFTRGIIIAFGIAMAVAGLVCIISYFRADPLEAVIGKNLSKGLLLIAVGLFCALRSDWFIVTFPILTMLYGVGILLSGIMKVQWTVDMLRLKRRNWGVVCISAVLSLLLAVIILINPFASTEFLWSFIAVCLIVGAVLDVVSVLFGRKHASEE